MLAGSGARGADTRQGAALPHAFLFIRPARRLRPGSCRWAAPRGTHKVPYRLLVVPRRICLVVPL